MRIIYKSDFETAIKDGVKTFYVFEPNNIYSYSNSVIDFYKIKEHCVIIPCKLEVIKDVNCGYLDFNAGGYSFDSKNSVKYALRELKKNIDKPFINKDKTYLHCFTAYNQFNDVDSSNEKHYNSFIEINTVTKDDSMLISDDENLVSYCPLHYIKIYTTYEEAVENFSNDISDNIQNMVYEIDNKANKDKRELYMFEGYIIGNTTY